MNGDWCFICGEGNPPVLEDHHTVPSRFGGGDTPENIFTLCANCHRAVEKMYNADFYYRLAAALGVDQSVVDYENPGTENSTRAGIQIKRDPPRAFVEECLAFDPNEVTVKADVYSAFHNFLKENGLSVAAWDFNDRGVQSKFGRVVSQYTDGDVTNTNKFGKKAYRNIRPSASGIEYFEGVELPSGTSRAFTDANTHIEHSD